MFRQPQTSWTNPASMIGFNASVESIIKHRKMNPAITAKHQLSTNPIVVGDELEKYTRLRLGIPLPAPESFRASNSQLPNRVVAAVADIKVAASGTAVVLDWLTSGGKPVSQELADKRAAICVACPKNVPGSWFTVAPAELIRSTLSARSDLKLETPYDDKLQSCDICKCLMRLKCHTPLEYIVNHTKPEIMAQFPKPCWISSRDA